MNGLSESIVLKIIIIGDANVGKTSLVKRYIDQQFKEELRPTIAVDVKKKTEFIKGENVCLTFFDTAGQEKFAAITDSYFKGACACIIVYDITKASSFYSVDKWYNKLRSIVADPIPVLIIGNKSDIEQQRDITTDLGASLAKKLGAFFIETSCLNGHNVNEAIKIISNESVTEKVIGSLRMSQRLSVRIERPLLEESEKVQCC